MGELGSGRFAEGGTEHNCGRGGSTFFASFAHAKRIPTLYSLELSSQVLAKHRSDAPGLYSLPFDGRSVCYSLVKVLPGPPSAAFALHDSTPLPSQLEYVLGGGGGSGGAGTSFLIGAGSSVAAASTKRAHTPLLPRVVFGVIVLAAAEGGPAPEECTRWLEALSALFEHKYGAAAYASPRGFPFEAFGRRIKEHAASLRSGGGGGGNGGGAAVGEGRGVAHVTRGSWVYCIGCRMYHRL